MPCKFDRDPSGAVTRITCSRGPAKARKCQFCDIPASAGKLCDGPRPKGVIRTGFGMNSATCDAFMCHFCATNVGPNRDHCPDCAKRGRETESADETREIDQQVSGRWEK